jgi:hypothetical protein
MSRRARPPASRVLLLSAVVVLVLASVVAVQRLAGEPAPRPGGPAASGRAAGTEGGRAAGRPDGTADQVHWSYTGARSVAVSWRGSASELRWGRTPAYGRTVAGRIPDPVPTSSSGPFWEAVVDGLQPGVTYHYSIGGQPDRTFSAPPAGPFRFDVQADIGDSETYPAVAEVQRMIAADRPAFVLAPGDLTYGDDHGQDAVDRHFEDVMAWSREAAYMPAWGNHEWDDGDDLRNYKGRFAIANPAASPGAPALGCCGEDWGWFDAGGVRFVSYPEPYRGAWDAWAPAAARVMAAAQADPAIRFIVTYGHRPAYSTGHHPGNHDLAAILDRLGDAHPKYKLNLNGHSHNYERFVPIHGVTHITATGGGASLETGWTSTDPRTAFRAMHLVHGRVQVGPDSIRFEAVCGPPARKQDRDCRQGSVLDSVVIGAARA